MFRRGTRVLTTVAVVVLVVPIAYALAGSESEGVSSGSSAKPSSQALERFAMRQTRRQAVRTCRVIPRRVLVQSFGVDKPATDNYISLGYARDVDISPIPLQRAAYNGCFKGLNQAGG